MTVRFKFQFSTFTFFLVVVANMPKTKPKLSSKLSAIVSAKPNIFKTDGSILFCKICNKNVSANQKSQVDQHIRSSKHKHLEQQNQNVDQNFIQSYSSRFYEDLCIALVAADIPLTKLKYKEFVKFLEKYTNQKVPDESTLRKNYVKRIYDLQIETIKQFVKGEYIWLSIDETTDVEGRFIANVIVGVLNVTENAKKRFLLNVVELVKCDHSSVARAFDDSIKLLGDCTDRDKVLLFVSDAAPYMKKAAEAIEVLYPKIIHVTCIVHGLHRVAEEIRKHFPDVDRLISNCKKIFLKAPSRIQHFKTKEPNLRLPPQPILTRWGTWLAAVQYYSENYEKLKAIINELNEEDAISIAVSKDLMKLTHMKRNLAFITANYAFLVDEISNLECTTMSLANQINILENVKTKILKVGGAVGNKVKDKLKNVLEKNKGYKTLCAIKNVIEGSADAETLDSKVEMFSPVEISHFKYAPISSVDVERSFSMYKNVLRTNRQSFQLENLKQYFVIYCNNALNST